MEHGSARFNAFYPQCSGRRLRSFPEELSPEHCG